MEENSIRAADGAVHVALTLKVWQIHNPTQKIVMIEEDERFISDGMWFRRS